MISREPPEKCYHCKKKITLEDLKPILQQKRPLECSSKGSRKGEQIWTYGLCNHCNKRVHLGVRTCTNTHRECWGTQIVKELGPKGDKETFWFCLECGFIEYIEKNQFL